MNAMANRGRILIGAGGVATVAPTSARRYLRSSQRYWLQADLPSVRQSGKILRSGTAETFIAQVDADNVSESPP
jgi:hypothetical protein